MEREERVWNGIKFYRYPDSPSEHSRKYFTAAPVRLHRAVWEAENGPIPEGYHVHHIDGDTGNNDIGNLECLSAGEHMRLHFEENPERREQARTHMREIQHLTKAWHKTEYGKQWHREHGWKNFQRQPETKDCDHCGDTYETISSRGRFCSNKCKTAWRVARGLDDVEKVCVVCQKTFVANKYAKARTCGRVCGGKLQSRSKRGLQPDGSRAE